MTNRMPSEQVHYLAFTPSQVEYLQEGLGLLLEKKERETAVINHLNNYMTFVVTNQLNRPQDNNS